MARFSPPTQQHALFALLRVLSVLVAGVVVVVALLYSAYINYTNLPGPELEIEAAAVEVDETGRKVSVGRSWLQRAGGLWVMHLEGSPEQIGHAHGRLSSRLFAELHSQVSTQLFERYRGGLERWAAAMLLRWDYRGADRGVADEYRTELAALAAALPESGQGPFAPYHLLFLYQSYHELGLRLEDTLAEGHAFAVGPKGDAAKVGNVVVGRTLSLDLGLDYEPPRLVTFYYPDGRYPFVSVGWPGLTGVVTGVNARGLFVSVNAARTDDPLEAGSPLPLVVRQVLERADTLDQAIEILKTTPIRSSGAVLVADGVGRRSAVVELAPRDAEERRVVRGEDRRAVWVTDHLVRDVFERDAMNDWVRRNTSSGYRYARLEELLRSRRTLSPTEAVEILRDRRGLEGQPLGLGNRNALENLATTHSVVADVSAMVLWVAEGPSTLGRYHAFDLRRLLSRSHATPAAPEDLAPDPLRYGEAFRDYREALAALDHARDRLHDGDPDAALISAKVALALAPDVGELHRLLGDIHRELRDLPAARLHYRRYLELVPGRLRDQERVRGILNELGGGP